MRRKNKILIMLIILVVFLLSFLLYKNHLANRMKEELNTRYPIDTFDVRNVKLTLIPLGATAEAKANNMGTKFDVSYVFNLGAKGNEIRDNMYKVKTENFYKEKLKPLTDKYSDWIEGYNIESTTELEKALDLNLSLLPARLDIILSTKIKNTDEYIDAVKFLLQKLSEHQQGDAEMKDLRAVRFYSFPGSITELNIKNIGLDANNLTQATYTEASESSESTSTNKDSADNTNATTKKTTAASASTEKINNPLYVLEFNSFLENIDLDTVKNGIRLRTITKKEHNLISEKYDLNKGALERLKAAEDRQTRDVAFSKLQESAKAEGQTLTTPREEEFNPSEKK